MTDLRNLHNRAIEELKLNEDDMLNMLAHLQTGYSRYQEVISKCSNQCYGVISTLHEKAERSRKTFLRAHAIFSSFIATPSIPDSLLNNQRMVSCSDLDEELIASDNYDIDEGDEDETME